MLPSRSLQVGYTAIDCTEHVTGVLSRCCMIVLWRRCVRDNGCHVMYDRLRNILIQQSSSAMPEEPSSERPKEIRQLLPAFSSSSSFSCRYSKNMWRNLMVRVPFVRRATIGTCCFFFVPSRVVSCCVGQISVDVATSLDKLCSAVSRYVRNSGPGGEMKEKLRSCRDASLQNHARVVLWRETVNRALNMASCDHRIR